MSPSYSAFHEFTAALHVLCCTVSCVLLCATLHVHGLTAYLCRCCQVQVGNKGIVIEPTDSKQSVYIYGCKNSVVQVRAAAERLLGAELVVEVGRGVLCT